MPRSDSPSGTLMDVSRLDRTRIALLASLLLVGCSWTVPSDPVTEDSPAAAYAEGFWALEASGGAAFADRSPDGTARVLVDDSGQVRVEREGRVSTILDTCADWFDGPNLSVTWSRDSRALLVDARGGVPGGIPGVCPDKRRWSIHLLDSGESRYLPKFRGTRDEALAAAGSPHSHRAFPAWVALEELRPEEVEVGIALWTGSDPVWRPIIERALFGRMPCREARRPANERLLSSSRSSPELRARFARAMVNHARLEECLEAPQLGDVLLEDARQSSDLAAELLEKLHNAWGLEAGLLRRELDPPERTVPAARPAASPTLTPTGYLTLGEEEIRWIRDSLDRMRFPLATRELRDRLEVPLHLLTPRGGVSSHGHEWQTRVLGSGYELELFFAGAETLLAEVREENPNANWTPLESARAHSSREEALEVVGATLLDLADKPDCGPIFGRFRSAGLECYEDTPWEAILVQTTAEGIRATRRRASDRSVSHLDFDGRTFHLVQNRFTRGGFSLVVDGEERSWPVAPGPELMHSSGELRREDDCLEVRIRGRAVASIRSGESELETRSCR